MRPEDQARSDEERWPEDPGATGGAARRPGASGEPPREPRRPEGAATSDPADPDLRPDRPHPDAVGPAGTRGAGGAEERLTRRSPRRAGSTADAEEPDLRPDRPHSAAEAAPAAGSPAAAVAGPEALEPEVVHVVERPRRRRWPRRLAVAVLLLAGLLAAARAALPHVLPGVVAGLARDAGLLVSWEELDLSLHEGSVGLSGLRVLPSDGGEAIARIERVEADVALRSLLRGEVVVDRVLVRGLRGHLERLPDGQLAIVRHIEESLGPSPEEAPEEPAEPTHWARDAVTFVRLKDVQVVDSRVRWVDRSVTPTVDADVGLSIRGQDVGILAPWPTRLQLQLEAPGVLERFDVDVRATNRAGETLPGQAARAELVLEGAHLAEVAGYLALADLRPLVDQGSLAANLFVALGETEHEPPALTASFAVEDLRVGGDGAEAATLERAALTLRPLPDGRLELTGIEALGLRGGVERRGDESLGLAGVLALGVDPHEAGDGPADQEGEAEPDEEEEEEEDEEEAGGVALGPIVASDLQVSFHDALTEPPADLSLTLHELRLDPDPAGGRSLRLRASAPRVAEELVVVGSASTRGEELAADLEVTGVGLTLEALAPYLNEAGVDPALADGRLRLRAHVVGRPGAGDELVAGGTLALKELSLRDGEEELFLLEDVHLTRARLAAPGAAGGRPLVAAERASLGSLRLPATLTDRHLRLFGLDLQLGDDPEDGEEALAELPAPEGTEPADEAVVPRTARLPLAGLDAPLIDVGEVRIDDVRLELVEALDEPARHLPVRLSGRSGRLRVTEGGSIAPTSFSLRAEAPGVADQVDLQGEVVALAGHVRAQARLFAEGLSGAQLDRLLADSGVEVALRDGSLRARLELDLHTLPSAGLALDARLAGLTLDDGDQLLVRVGEARLGDAILDPAHDAYLLPVVTLRGVEGRVVRRPDERLAVAGLILGEGAQPTQLPPLGARDDDPLEPDEPELPPLAAGEQPPRTKQVAGRPTELPPLDEAEPATPEEVLPRHLLPNLRIDELEVRVERIVYEDQSRPDVPPVVLSDLVLENVYAHQRTPIVIDADRPGAAPPLGLALHARAAPVLRRTAITLEGSPFGREPELSLTFEVEGLDGGALARVAPGLNEVIDAGQLVDANLHLHVEGILRRAVRDLPPALAGEAHVRDLSITVAGAEGRVTLLELAAAHAEIEKFVPSTGEIRVVEAVVTGLEGEVAREEEGWRVAGVLIRAGEEEEPDEEEVPVRPRIDVQQILLNQVAMTYVDRTVSPPFRLPLVGLDLEATYQDGVSITHLTVEGFSRAGKVPLTARRTSLLDRMTGILRGELGQGGGSGEELPLFNDLALTGWIHIEPNLTGSIDLRLQDLQLRAIPGLLKEAEVDIGAGILSTRFSAQFLPDGDLAVEGTVTIEDLALTEQPGGPVASFLQLPANLSTDAAVFLLRDEGGVIEIPVSLRIATGAGEGRTGAVLKAVGKALGQVIATAVVKSPLRVLKTMANIGEGMAELIPGVENLFGPDRYEDEPPREVVFAPGSTLVPEWDQRQLVELAERLDDEEDLVLVVSHELGAGDVERIEARTSPPRHDALELLGRLLVRRGRLDDRRQARLRDAYRAAASDDVDLDRLDALSEEVRDLERRLGVVEGHLAEIYGMLRSDVDFRARRRAREAALTLAQARLDAVREVLLVNIPPANRVRERIRVLRPTLAGDEVRPTGQVDVVLQARPAR